VVGQPSKAALTTKETRLRNPVSLRDEAADGTGARGVAGINGNHHSPSQRCLVFNEAPELLEGPGVMLPTLLTPDLLFGNMRAIINYKSHNPRSIRCLIQMSKSARLNSVPIVQETKSGWQSMIGSIAKPIRNVGRFYHQTQTVSVEREREIGEKTLNGERSFGNSFSRFSERFVLGVVFLTIAHSRLIISMAAATGNAKLQSLLRLIIGIFSQLDLLNTPYSALTAIASSASKTKNIVALATTDSSVDERDTAKDTFLKGDAGDVVASVVRLRYHIKEGLEVPIQPTLSGDFHVPLSIQEDRVHVKPASSR